MATKPEHVWFSLLSHLGIDYVLHVHSNTDGTWTREHHLFVDDELIAKVLRWQLRFDSPDVVRIFEGDPPPF